MKKSPLLLLCMLAGTMMLPSCDKTVGESVDMTKLTLEAAVTQFDDSGFTVKYTAGEQCDHIEYALVASVDAKEAYDKFEQGSLADIRQLVLPETEVVFQQDSIGPYTLFSRPVASDGTKGAVVKSYATASSAGVLMSYYDAIIVKLKAVVSDPNCEGVGVQVASKQVVDVDMGSTIDEVLNLYYQFGMIPVYTPDSEFVVALNGLPDEVYYIGIVATDSAGAIISTSSYTLVAPQYDASLPQPGALTIEAKELYDDSARLVYTMGENTSCYYQGVLTVANYEDLYTNPAESYKDDPEGYIRQYVAFFANPMVTDDDYVWPDLLPGTDYIALGYPMNANGTLGYGTTAATYFKTTGTAPEEEAALKSGVLKSGRAPHVIRAITSKDQLPAVMRK